jgi:hypothetical protein
MAWVDRSLYALAKIECVILPSSIAQITGTWTKKSEARFGPKLSTFMLKN